MSKIRVGLVGTGNWTRYGHIPVLQLLPEYEIAGIWSRRRENAETAAQNFGIPKVFSDADELARDPDLDLVAVLSPAPQHAATARSAIAAGKDVYCEWPLTTTLADTEELLDLARAAGVRHVVGLQRRLGASARHARDLVAGGYVGQMRSVRMHVSMEYFAASRPPGLAWTIDPANFSHLLSIYGGHFFDMLFQIVGGPKTVSTMVESQFPALTLSETGESFPNHTPDQVAVIGTLRNGAILSVQIEGGKRNGAGLQIDITGMEGDLRISNSSSFGGPESDRIEGSQGLGERLRELPIPAPYHDGIPPSALDASVLDLAHLYAAHARDRQDGTHTAPDFADAVRMHRFINAINQSSATGTWQSAGW
jgi:predicted dehydrogenase